RPRRPGRSRDAENAAPGTEAERGGRPERPGGRPAGGRPEPPGARPEPPPLIRRPAPGAVGHLPARRSLRGGRACGRPLGGLGRGLPCSSADVPARPGPRSGAGERSSTGRYSNGGGRGRAHALIPRGEGPGAPRRPDRVITRIPDSL